MLGHLGSGQTTQDNYNLAGEFNRRAGAGSRGYVVFSFAGEDALFTANLSKAVGALGYSTYMANPNSVSTVTMGQRPDGTGGRTMKLANGALDYDTLNQMSQMPNAGAGMPEPHQQEWARSATNANLGVIVMSPARRGKSSKYLQFEEDWFRKGNTKTIQVFVSTPLDQAARQVAAAV